MKIKGVYSFLIFSCLTGSIFGQGTTFDVEYAQICLIDSIAPDTVVQFWRFTQANNPGEFQVDRTFDLSATYAPTGTVLPCCSCLTEATAMDGAGFGGGGSIGDIAFSNSAPLNALLFLSCLVATLLFIPRRKIIAALIVASPLALSAQPGTVYDVEYTCICLVDSIAADTITQFWRFTQANNPGEFQVDLTFDLSATYAPSGEIIGCKDYYLGDNPGGSGTAGTLAIWTGANSLGNSNVTESAQILSSAFTGAFKPPSGTTAQQPAGSPGYLRFNTTQSGFEGYNGSAYQFLPWADADNWTNTYVPYSDGNKLITSANFLFRTSDSDGLIIGGADTGANGLNVRRLAGSGNIASFETNTGTDVLDIESTGLLSFAAGFSNNPGISWYGTGTAIRGTSSGINATCTNSGGNKALRVVVGSTEIANIGGNQLGSQPTQTGVFVNSGSVFAAAVGGVTTTIRGGVGSTIGGPMVVLGGPSSNSNSNAGSTYLQGGHLGQAWYSNGGVPGDLYIQTFNDTDDSATHIATYNIPKILAKFTRGPAYNIELYELSATTSGIRTLTMEADTVKYRIENIGAVSTSTDGSGDIAVTHSMGTTPTAVVVTVTGTTPYVCTVHTKGGTTFTVRFFDMAGAAVTSTAVTFDWLAKT